MKLAILLSLAVGACAVQPAALESDPTSDPISDQISDEITVAGPPALEPTESVWWNAKNTVDDLWPINDPSIVSAQVLYRKAWDSSAGPTFVAFVVWNGNRIGWIYRVHVGSDGATFHNAVQAMIAQRTHTINGSDSSSGGATTTGNGKPTPHPNVDGSIAYSIDYLTNVRQNAALIHAAYVNFENFDPAHASAPVCSAAGVP